MLTAPNFNDLKKDIPAGIVVFLVALPLCLGIALASNAPLFSGIVTGVIAGLVVSLLSGSELSVSGPANGVTVIVAAGIAKVGGFETVLCALIIAGLFQIALGALRAGSLAGFFPNAVIEGMLAAIGVTIVLKQIPHALGGSAQFDNELGFWHFLPQDNTFAQIFNSIVSLSPTALAISLVSLILLRAWDSPRIKNNRWLAAIPGPLAVVVLGIVVNGLFHAGFPGLALYATDGHLVQLPKVDSFASLLNELHAPNFAGFATASVWMLGITIALIASIETLLSLESTDKMDPERRTSNNNRELIAQGIGNILCGLAGGIPMTSVIVRSSANIYAGARTRYSSFVHGLVLLVAAISIPEMLNMIPLASLAAVLIYVGFKLAKPTLIRKVYAQGFTQFVPFMVTVLAVLFTDLLKGVMIGLVVGLVFVIKASYYSAITVINDGKDYLVRFSKDVTFVHKIKLKKELRLVPHGSNVIIDATHAMFIDHDIYEMIKDFVEAAPNRRIQVNMRNMEHKRFDFLLNAKTR